MLRSILGIPDESITRNPFTGAFDMKASIFTRTNVFANEMRNRYLDNGMEYQLIRNTEILSPGPVAPPYSEEALALRFAERHVNVICYVAEWKKWLIWDGIKWREDETRYVFFLARELCRQAANEVNEPDVQRRIASARDEPSSKLSAAYHGEHGGTDPLAQLHDRTRVVADDRLAINLKDRFLHQAQLVEQYIGCRGLDAGDRDAAEPPAVFQFVLRYKAKRAVVGFPRLGGAARVLWQRLVGGDEPIERSDERAIGNGKLGRTARTPAIELWIEDFVQRCLAIA
jgi:hypothetical protein